METESPLKKIAREQAEREKEKFDALQAKQREEKAKDEKLAQLKNKMLEVVRDKEPGVTWDSPKADVLGDVRKAMDEMKARVASTHAILVGKAINAAGSGQYVQMELFPKVPVEKGKSAYYTFTKKSENGPDLIIDEDFDYEDDGTAYYNIECKVEDKMSTLPQLKQNMSYAETKLRERLSADNKRVKGTVWFEYSVEGENIDVDAICNYEDVPGATRG